MYLHFAVMGLAALGIALGWRYRWSVAAYAVLFTWVELIDRTLYLNHYYWVSLTAGADGVPPAAPDVVARRPGRAGRGGRTAAPAGQTVPASVVWLLRTQLAMVYLFAGMAKVGVDWLVHAQPLATWLPARASLPVIGPLLTLPGVALLMSWAGALVRPDHRRLAALAPIPAVGLRGRGGLPSAHLAAVPVDRAVPVADDRRDAGVLRPGLAAPVPPRRWQRWRRPGSAVRRSRRSPWSPWPPTSP